MTNREKFKEDFGFEPDVSHCPKIGKEKCAVCPYAEKPFGKCSADWWNSEYQGEPTKTDLISKEEALDLFPLILSGELLTIATVREQLRELQTVEAVPLSVIEDIKYNVEKYFVDNIWAKKDDCSEETKHFKAVLGIIDKAVKECTHENN